MRLRDRLREWWAPTPTPDVNDEQADDEQADEDDDDECMTCDAPAGPSGYCDDCERGVHTALYM